MSMTQTLSADRVGGLIWIVFGAAVVYGSWIMDRLESLGIPPATAPGVVPGLLGIGIVIFGLVLVVRREPAARLAAAVPPDAAVDATPGAASDLGAVPHADEFHWKRGLLSWVLCMTYAAVLLGSGLHYWVLTVSFLLLHVLLLDETERVPARPTARRLIVAAILAPAVATAVMLVFERIFLVRLP
jgi:putative tricarboxylic transport membrane protein